MNIGNNWEEIYTGIREGFQNQTDTIYVMAIFTDSFELDIYQDEIFNESGKMFQKKERLLDLRVFDAKQEIRFVRSTIARPFQMVCLKDSDYQNQDIIESVQLLDIDIARTKKEQCYETAGIVRATGGGYYSFPLAGYVDAKVRIKSYIDYDENGCAYVKAWRLAGFQN